MTETKWGTTEFWLENWKEISDRTLTDDETRTWARMLRLSASPQGAIAIDEVERQIEIRAVLPQIQVPTLVMRSRFDREHAYWEDTPWVAQQIPGARYTELPSPDHIALQPEAYAELEAFLSQIHRHEAVFDRVLATVLFTDIVDSTVQSTALGDREWRRLREEHDRVVRAQLSRYRGREIKTMGDGFLASFDGPARAVYCAQAIAEHIRSLGIEVRSGLHTGEVELDGDDVAGIAVAIGARVAARAEPSEVLVSQTVKDLVAGSGLVFEDAGEHELKGVPGIWHLFRVADSDAHAHA
jgi:class 3 adenylate cyclase